MVCRAVRFITFIRPILYCKRHNSNYALSLKLNEVFIETCKNCGRIILNRPDDRNALSISMVNQMFPVLKQWQESKSLVIIKANGDEAFCGGNDARGLVEAELRGEMYAKKFYQVGLSLNALIASYKIPCVVLVNGLVLGDGAGLMVHAEYSVVTDKCVFAMPYCAMGFCPDVGASFFLPRLLGHFGRYLALTGHAIRGRDIQRINLATYYCHNGLDALENALEQCDGHEDVRRILRKYECKDSDQFSMGNHLKEIDYCFGAVTVEEIIDRLRSEGSQWAMETLNEIMYMSPIFLKVTHEALNRGQYMDLKECLNMEYNMLQVAIAHKDLYEGVRAKIIDEDNNPSWRPATLEEVTPEHVNAFFPNILTKAIP